MAAQGVLLARHSLYQGSYTERGIFRAPLCSRLGETPIFYLLNFPCSFPFGGHGCMHHDKALSQGTSGREARPDLGSRMRPACASDQPGLVLWWQDGDPASSKPGLHLPEQALWPPVCWSLKPDFGISSPWLDLRVTKLQEPVCQGGGGVKVASLSGFPETRIRKQSQCHPGQQGCDSADKGRLIDK